MQIIIIPSDRSSRGQWSFTLKTLLILVSLISLVVVASLKMAEIKTYSMYVKEYINTLSMPTANLETVAISPEKQDSLSQVSTESEHMMVDSELMLQDYYSQRLGQLQAELLRMKALTEKISEMAGVDTSSFILEKDPAQGGVEFAGEKILLTEFKKELAQLDAEFKSQNEVLKNLQHFYFMTDSIQGAIPEGSPSEKGWISSHYGNRIDPFTGRTTFHHGLDIAGREGSEVSSVADGIISWTGRKTGYGELVEIDHGNGYLTRYAHNKTLKVRVGDRVEKGDVIALMGSTGRSTGPHVHFEILRDGKRINPRDFVKG